MEFSLFHREAVECCGFKYSYTRGSSPCMTAYYITTDKSDDNLYIPHLCLILHGSLQLLDQRVSCCLDTPCLSHVSRSVCLHYFLISDIFMCKICDPYNFILGQACSACPSKSYLLIYCMWKWIVVTLEIMIYLIR